MFQIIVLGTITITFLIITIAAISTKEHVVSVLIGFLFLLFSHMTFDYTTDFGEDF